DGLTPEFFKSFQIGHGTRQGCPISPLLFALAIEPLAEVIRTDPQVAGITIGPQKHTISLYADDVLLFLSNPEVSMVRIIEIIKSFGQFLGYDINYSKSEAMPLTLHTPSTSSSAVPFRWSPSGFVYLGIHITLSLSGLYKANFIPLIRKIKEDLAHWTSLPLSPIGRVNLFKMNILPRLLYVFQMVPVLLTRRSLSILNSSLSSFLWRNKRARLKLQKLQLRVGDGGLSLPNIKYYQLACLGRYLWEWFRNDPRSTWLSIEATPLDPIPLRNILYTSKKWVANRVRANLLLQNTLKVWRIFNKIGSQEDSLSLFTPIHLNPDFPPGLEDSAFFLWSEKGIGTVKSFNQLIEQHNLPSKHLFRYLQIHSFVSSEARLYPGGFSCSSIEEVQTLQKGLHGLIWSDIPRKNQT
uniref:Reverse transcriptase domain-containing protein n=1 Tax=Amphiprion ocellaris TaxID=80972 RepID=A0A3Q1BKU0_AMPOC